MIGINVYDNVISEEQRVYMLDYLNGPIFSGTHTSNGDVGNQRLFFRADLIKIPLFLNVVSTIKNFLPSDSEYDLIRCWAIAHQSGSHGDLHQDTGGDISVIVYPHENWNANWGGETIFFNPEKYEIIKSILPGARRAVFFDSNIYHCARPTTSSFLGIRYVINYLFKKK